jgi:hypothetical protein
MRHLFFRCPFTKNCLVPNQLFSVNYCQYKETIEVFFFHVHHYTNVLEYLERKKFLDLQ